MSYTWSDNLITGYETIDNNHLILIEAANDLLSACSVGKGYEKLTDTFEVLNSYILDNLPIEEHLMLKYDYADFFYHKMQHEAFATLTYQLMEEYHLEEKNLSLLAKINSLFIYWINYHINHENNKMCSYFHYCDENEFDFIISN